MNLPVVQKKKSGQKIGPTSKSLLVNLLCPMYPSPEIAARLLSTNWFPYWFLSRVGSQRAGASGGDFSAEKRPARKQWWKQREFDLGQKLWKRLDISNRWSGQIITTSAEVTLNGGLIRELPQNPLNLGLGIIRKFAQDGGSFEV